ncbi:MAG: VOC family protein [Nocardioidaceae bacterium]
MTTATPATPVTASLAAMVLDCADPAALAHFYAGLLSREIVGAEGDGWVELSGEPPVLAFQRVESYQPPSWPNGAPQQAHLDVAVSDFSRWHDRVTELGGAALDPVAPPPAEGSRTYRVYADPAGHPFCLCRCHP